MDLNNGFQIPSFQTLSLHVLIRALKQIMRLLYQLNFSLRDRITVFKKFLNSKLNILIFFINLYFLQRCQSMMNVKSVE